MGQVYTVVIELAGGEERTFEAAADEYVLGAARRAGIDLPSMCEVGWDTACAVRVLEGRLDHSDARRYYPEDEEAGFALICRARPCSDLRLRSHATAEMREHRDAAGLPVPRGR